MKSGIRSLFSLDYYTGVLNGERRFRVFLFTFLVSLIIGIPTSVVFIKEIYPLTRNVESKALVFVDKYYPENLEVKIKDGKATTNVEEPYFVTLPKEILEKPETFDQHHDSVSKVRILAIDTKGKAEDFESYQSMALLTENSLVYYQDGNINIRSLREVGDLTINKDKANSEIKKYSEKYKLQSLITGGVSLLPVFIILGSFIYILFSIFMLTIIVWIMIKINLLKFSFGKIFLFTAAVGLIPTFIWGLISAIPFIDIPILYFDFIIDIFVLGVCYLGIVKIKNNSISVHVPAKAQDTETVKTENSQPAADSKKSVEGVGEDKKV